MPDSRIHWMLGTAVCWFAACERLLATEVVGNLDLAAFAGDAMSTSRSRLTRGSVRFELTQSAVNHYLRVAGLWVWEGERDYFPGTVEKQRPAAEMGNGHRAAPPSEVIWFRTAAEECLYDSGRQIAFRRTPPGKATIISFPTRPFLDAFYVRPWPKRLSLLEGGARRTRSCRSSGSRRTPAAEP